LVVGGNSDSDSGDDEVTDQHSSGTDEEKRAATSATDIAKKKKRRKSDYARQLWRERHVLDEEKSRNSSSDVDDVGSDSNDEGVGNTRVLEERSSLCNEKEESVSRLHRTKSERTLT
jgi:hypothetical protein